MEHFVSFWQWMIFLCFNRVSFVRCVYGFLQDGKETSDTTFHSRSDVSWCHECFSFFRPWVFMDGDVEPLSWPSLFLWQLIGLAIVTLVYLFLGHESSTQSKRINTDNFPASTSITVMIESSKLFLEYSMTTHSSDIVSKFTWRREKYLQSKVFVLFWISS